MILKTRSSTPPKATPATIIPSTAAGEAVDFQRYVAGMITDRRANPGSDDLVADIVASTDEVPQPPSDNVLVGLVMTVLFAGHESTTSLITNTVKLLLHHPRPAGRGARRPQPAACRKHRDAAVRPAGVPLSVQPSAASRACGCCGAKHPHGLQ